MGKDVFGLEVSANSPDIIDVINTFTLEIVGNGANPQLILPAVELYPESSLLHCYAAAFYLFGQETLLTTQAKTHLAQAKNNLTTANEREKLLYHAISAWAELNYEKAITTLTNITQRWSRDVLAAKFAEWLFYCTGQAYQAERFFQMCSAMERDNSENADFLAIYSFSLELTKQYDKAHRVANNALTIKKLTPWAHHTLSHVYLMQGKMEEGARVLDSFQPSWSSINPFLACHNNWHLALFHIAELDEKKAMTIYQEKIWGPYPDIILQQIDAISFLWRMDMAGLGQHKEWARIIPHLGEHPGSHYVPFNNIHCFYALAKDKDEAVLKSALNEVETYSSLLTGKESHVWQKITIPLLHAVIAFAREDYKRCKTLLTPIIEDMFCVGGSDAQDEVLQQTYYVSLLKLGKHEAAEAYFANHLNHYRHTPLGEYWRSHLI